MKIRSGPCVVAVLASALALGVSGSAGAAGHARGPKLHRVALSAPSVSASSSSEQGQIADEEAEAAAAPKHGGRWFASRLPAGGSISDGQVVHTIKKGDSWQSIAESYLDLTSVYDPNELAKAIVKENLPESKHGASPGLHVRIPHILPNAPKSGARERIGLPKDGVVKGLYVRGSTAGSHNFPSFLDKVVSHGMNAIVLDVKDYDGLLTYESKVPLAVEVGATKDPPIRSYQRAVRFAHERGIRVIARVSCFNDQLVSKHHASMGIKGVSGHQYRNGWLNPMDERAQAYVADLVREVIGFGVDEVQLDYVRFPVLGMKNIDFGLDTRKEPRAKVEVITKFVERIHAITHAHDVPLSLDVFGVIAFGKKVDIQNLGQDPAELSKHAEFLSAMVYPSHYDPGFMGFDEPGNHPELVGLGVKHMIENVEEQGVHNGAKMRPWLQAMRHKSSNYGAGYIQDEIRTGDKAGAQGWLLWNPGQVYDVAWQALPRKQTPKEQHAQHDKQDKQEKKLKAVVAKRR